MAGDSTDPDSFDVSGPIYEHAQQANHVMTVFVVLVMLLMGSIVIGTGDTGSLLMVIAFLVFLGVIMFAFNKLYVTVDSGEVSARFRWGWPERRYSLADVHRVDVVRNKWWYGFGVRITPHGWMYNVWGLDAVQLNFHDGQTFRIGSDEPARLATALGYSPAEGEPVD